MRILPIDIGLTVGWAVVEAGKAPITGSFKIPGSANELGVAGIAISKGVRDLVTEHRPDAIVLCMPFVGLFEKKGKGGKPSTFGANVFTMKLLFGLYGVVRTTAETLHIPAHDVMETDARKQVLGFSPSGKDRKERIMETLRNRGWYVCDDHAGDALVAGIHQLNKFNPALAVETTPLFMRTHKNGKIEGARRRRPSSRLKAV